MTGWSLQTWYISGGGAKITTESAFVTNGQYALQFTANGRRLLDACYQDLRLAPGDYTMSADVAPSIGTVVTLGAQYLNTSIPSTVVTSGPGQNMRLVLNFTVTDGSNPVRVYSLGSQSRYVRSNYGVDNFVLVRR